MDLSSLVPEFRAEATEHLDALNAQLLTLERDPAAPGPIRAMFLSAHTIKGSAAMLDLADIRVLAHAMEDVLANLRDTSRSLDAGTADLLFQALDMLRHLVGQATPGSISAEPAIAELAAALAKRAGGPGEEAADGVGPSAASNAPRALLVEDSATVRMLETMLLEDAGFRVDAVADGRQALALALAQSFDLVVTGIETAGLRGWDLAESLRNVTSRCSIPIIVMSSDDSPEDRRHAAELGLHAYLQKGSLERQRLTDVARELRAGSAP